MSSAGQLVIKNYVLEIHAEIVFATVWLQTYFQVTEIVFAMA